MHNMKNIKVEKVTLNIGAGKDQSRLEKGIMLLKAISNTTPIKTITSKRIQEWGLRPGLPIGCKLTLRKANIIKILPRLLEAVENKLMERQFDQNGNIAFGIHEYIEIPGVKYDPKIGILGFEVAVSLIRPGYRVSKRKIRQRSIGKRHEITAEDSLKWAQENFGVKLKEED